jgi:photosystem II stability/assembly factor-like uncharacterized protein
MTTDVVIRIAKAARAFGCLRKSIFQDKGLSIVTKEGSLFCSGAFGVAVWSRDLDVEGQGS